MRIVLAVATVVVPLVFTIACGGGKKEANTGGVTETGPTGAPVETASASPDISASSSGGPEPTGSAMKSPE